MIRVLNSLTLILFVASIVLQNPLLFLLAAMLALVMLATIVWGRYALAGVTYTRRLAVTRMFAGEENDLWIEIVNAKPPPLAWLRADDEFPGEVELLKGTLYHSHKPTRNLLTNLFSLRFYERVRKHYRLRARQRGVLEFGPVELRSGDMFGLRTQQQECGRTDRLIVYPRVVPLTTLGLPAAHPFGDAKMRRKLATDPLRLMSVRAYAAGDSPRYIHWKASARRGELQTKVFEPSAQRVAGIFLDVQTVPSEHQGYVPEYLEFGVSAAASVARFLLDARESVGLYANGARRNEIEWVRIAPAGHAAQWVTILDTLARLNYLTGTPLARALQAELAGLAFGATVIVISAVVTEDLIAALLVTRDAGHPVTLLAIGESAPANVPAEVNMVWLGGRDAFRVVSDPEFEVSPQNRASAVPGL